MVDDPKSTGPTLAGEDLSPDPLTRRAQIRAVMGLDDDGTQAAVDEIARLRGQLDDARAATERWQRYFTDTPGVAAANAEIVSLRSQLAAMTAARDEACDLASGHRKHIDERVDELRKVGSSGAGEG